MRKDNGARAPARRGVPAPGEATSGGLAAWAFSIRLYHGPVLAAASSPVSLWGLRVPSIVFSLRTSRRSPHYLSDLLPDCRGCLPKRLAAGVRRPSAVSIVQGGHGAIPLLAESRQAFILVKAINMLVGLLVGAALLGLGF